MTAVARFLEDNDSRTCDIIPLSSLRFLPDKYNFSNTRIISKVHRHAPRWGQSSNLTAVLRSDYSSNDDGGNSYFWGICVSALLMSSIVLLWAVVLIGLRCAGHKRVGMVCSGTPPPRVRRHKKLESAEKPPLEGADDEPTRITEQQTVVVKSEGQSLTSARLMQNLRLVVLGCCVGMIVCIILLMTKGVPNLIQASSHVSAALLDSQSLTNDAIVLWDAYVERQKITIQETQAYLQDFNSFCPTKFENETLCTNITDVSSCDWSALPSVIAPLVESLFVSSLALIWDDVNDIRDDLVELYDVFGQAHDASNNFDWVFALATLFAVLLLLLTLLLTLGIVHLIFFWEPDLSPQSQPSLMQSTVANRTEEKAVHWSTKVFQSVCSFANASRHYNWCWLPLFIFFVAMTLFFSLAFSVGTVTSADMCYGSPDENVILVLQKSGVVENLLLSFFLFYIRGCPRDQIPDHYMQAIQTVDAVAQDLQALLYELQNESTTEEPWQVTCGTDPVLLEATSNALQETVCTVEDALMDLQEFLACENFRPVYRELAYDALCFQSINGFYYMTVSQWFIVVFSMVMLTARIAFYENTRLGLVAGSNHENSLHKDGKKGDVMSNGACETGKEEEEVINTFAMEPLTAPAHHSNGACEIGKEEEEIINTFAMEPAPSSASPDLKVELKEEYVRNC